MDLDSDLSEIPCNECGKKGGLSIEMRIEAKPLGTHSLSGTQLKMSANKWPWMNCAHCGAECRGKLSERDAH